MNNQCCADKYLNLNFVFIESALTVCFIYLLCIYILNLKKF